MSTIHRLRLKFEFIHVGVSGTRKVKLETEVTQSVILISSLICKSPTLLSFRW